MPDDHVCGQDCTSMKLSCRANRAAAQAAQEATVPGKEEKRAVSKSQQRLGAMCSHGIHPKGGCPPEDVSRELAKTPHKGLPERKKKR